MSIRKEDLIRPVYDMVLDPFKFEDFTDLWGRFTSESSSEEVELVAHDFLPAHFQRTLSILEKVGRVPADSIIATDAISASREPVLALNSDGEILDLNKLAQDWLPNAKIGQSCFQSLARDSFSSLKSAISDLQRSNIVVPVLLLLKNNQPALFGLQRTSSSGVFLAKIYGVAWGNEIERSLRDIYSLSPKELETLRLLYSGLSVVEIAEQSFRTEDTIRKHVKSIKKKMRTSTLPELMRLVTGLNFKPSQSRPQWFSAHCRQHEIELQDGRFLAYYDLGPKDGVPIVVLHSLIHSPELLSDTVELFSKNNFRLIGVSRAGYGASTRLNNKACLFENFSRDLKQLLDQLKLDQVNLLALSAGSMYAFYVASKMPSRINSIVAAAGVVPFVSDTQFADMAPSSKLNLYAANNFPKLYPLLIRAAMALLDSGNVDKINRTILKGSESDIAQYNVPKTLAQLGRNYRFISSQGYREYAEEVALVTSKQYGEFVDKIKCPVLMIHGCDDPIISYDSVRDFSEQRRHVELKAIQNAGQLLMYSHEEDLVNWSIDFFKDR